MNQTAYQRLERMTADADSCTLPRRPSAHANAACAGLVMLSSLCMLTGCATQEKSMSPVVSSVPAPYQAEAIALENDPVAYLRQVGEHCAALDQYRLTFYRQERLGIIPSMQPMETIQASFRREPFSVKFEWADEEMPYYESVYVAGQNDNKLVIRERKGIFPFPPTVRAVEVDLPAKLGKAKNPITSFGLAQLVTRTLGPLDDPALREVTTIRYQGITNLQPHNAPVHHLRIEHPPAEGYRYTVQDFYIDAQTKLPAGTDLWLPDGQLDVSYRYADVDTAVQLADQDFKIKRGKAATTRPAGSKTRATTRSANP